MCNLYIPVILFITLKSLKSPASPRNFWALRNGCERTGVEKGETEICGECRDLVNLQLCLEQDFRPDQLPFALSWVTLSTIKP